MAAFHAAKEAKWLRDLLIELNLTDLPSDKPVVLLGDNDQATRWTIHGMVTTGNKTVRMNYHWVQVMYWELGCQSVGVVYYVSWSGAIWRMARQDC